MIGSPIGFDPTTVLNKTEQASDTEDNVPLDSATRGSRIAWLKAHVAPLRSIDIADDDFPDLGAFAEAVGDARIVTLGEQTHGDGTTFLAKSRLVRFLHSRMGFDVLAFESGLYEMRKVWELIRNGEAAPTAIGRGLFGIWSRSRQVQPLIEYVGAHAHSSQPLELAGFDCQFTGVASRDHLVDDLSQFLAAHGTDLASIADWPRFRAALGQFTANSNPAEWKPEERSLVLSMIGTLTGRTATVDGAEAAFWRQLLKSIKALTQIRGAAWTDWPAFRADFNLRDAAMADNLIWLARDFHPRRKIIVWAATFHTVRYPDLTSPDGRTNMGTHVWRALGDAVYTVGFTGYEGRRSFVSAGELSPPPADSLEGLWGATAQQNAFLDLRRIPAGGEWLQAPFPSRLLSEDNDAAQADWRKYLDAVVFLRTMRPSTRVD